MIVYLTKKKPKKKQTGIFSRFSIMELGLELQYTFLCMYKKSFFENLFLLLSYVCFIFWCVLFGILRIKEYVYGNSRQNIMLFTKNKVKCQRYLATFKLCIVFLWNI